MDNTPTRVRLIGGPSTLAPSPLRLLKGKFRTRLSSPKDFSYTLSAQALNSGGLAQREMASPKVWVKLDGAVWEKRPAVWPG